MPVVAIAVWSLSKIAHNQSFGAESEWTKRPLVQRFATSAPIEPAVIWRGHTKERA